MNDATSLYNSYENYSETSATYDQFRTPIGVDVILEILAAGGIAPEGARLLDAGCGTGNYLVALRGRFSSLVGLEFNSSMLERAEAKLATAANVSLCQGSILAMPFPEASFDVVMLNQVIHHLDTAGDTSSGDWPNLVRALGECRRVLRCGGALVINTCTREQIEKGSWYNALIPAAVARMARRYVPVEILAKLLAEVGFDIGKGRSPDGLFGGDRYFDSSGPFDKGWRNGDSLWSLATDAELEAGLRELRKLHDSGQAEAFVRKQDQSRHTVGQSVTVPAWRI